MNIKVLVLKIKLYAPWVHSLKEKRMVVKSLLAKIRNKLQSCGEIERSYELEFDRGTNRSMMGEYILYYRGKIVGDIYDDRLKDVRRLVK